MIDIRTVFIYLHKFNTDNNTVAIWRDSDDDPDSHSFGQTFVPKAPRWLVVPLICRLITDERFDFSIEEGTMVFRRKE